MYSPAAFYLEFDGNRTGKIKRAIVASTLFLLNTQTGFSPAWFLPPGWAKISGVDP
jgi:hypothetical protein